MFKLNNFTQQCVCSSSGCQVPIGNGVCGETRTLDIIHEFRRLYEEKMQQIEMEAGADSLQEKLKLQEEWIGDLTEQNELLVRAVKELEHEATDRVQLLEEKLQHSAHCISEVMKRYRDFDVTSDLLAEPTKKVTDLENDIKNLLEIIRRIREEDSWSTEGLCFYEVNKNDIFGYSDMKIGDKKFSETWDSNTLEGEKMLKNKESLVKTLQGKVEYYCSFGDVESMAKELKVKKEEYDSLKQTMADMRQALTEEVASKHDNILQLKKDIQNLEERCIQADKQAIFREDIIKELRKEIKELKTKITQEEMGKLNTTIEELHESLERTQKLREQEDMTHNCEIRRLKDTINTLQNNLKDTEQNPKVCKICQGRAKVGFLENTEIQVNLCEDLFEKQIAEIKTKEEIILLQKNTIDIVQKDLQKTKESLLEMTALLEEKSYEIQHMKCKISELENALQDSEQRATNLQSAVDLYLNSINVLEASEEKAKLEIEQQKLTITNLQDSLVATKQELDILRQKSEENVQRHYLALACLKSFLIDSEERSSSLLTECLDVVTKYEQLQDLNFDLESEQWSSLQDIELFETQLHKYQNLLRKREDECAEYKQQCKKLTKQKDCYEEVIAYFKQEMGLMAEQLTNLQEMLVLSNESSQQEACRLMEAFAKVESLNETLTYQLSATEQKVQLENQMNQLHEIKIHELEQLINKKENDIWKHDEAIRNIRDTLQRSQKQNEELRCTIIALNQTISQLHCAVQHYENENCRNKESTEQCKSQISICKSKLVDLKSTLDKKTAELVKLEMAYNSQNRTLKSAQKELEAIRKTEEEKQIRISCTVKDIQEKLQNTEASYQKLCDECNKLRAQLACVSRKEAVKDLEVKRYKKIVLDLKTALVELNKSLTNKDIQNKCKNPNCAVTQSDETSNEIAGCSCEMVFYQSVAENLKKSVMDLRKKLEETSQRNKQLEQESKSKETKLLELSKSHAMKDQEYNELRQKLKDKLEQTRAEELRYTELADQFENEIEKMKHELDMKTSHINDIKKSAQEMDSSRCIQLACAHEEMNHLKADLHRLMKKQLALNDENKQLHSHSERMQSTVKVLEERSQLFKSQLEQYLAELQTLQADKETLINKNKDLLNELRCLQTSYGTTSKQHRQFCETIKHLEAELEAVKTNRDDISIESKHVISYVRSHLEEQRKINAYMTKRERNYCNTIKKLKMINQTLQCSVPTAKPSRGNISRACCESPDSSWSLGSQGTTSAYDEESPSSSPFPNMNDWYSPNFRNQSEEESGDEYLHRLEKLTCQVRKTNKMWECERAGTTRFSENKVSRDKRK